MEDHLSYTDENGNLIFKSSYFKNRGSCCKSSCLHCPYGYTLNNIGIKTEPINSNNDHKSMTFFKKYVQGDSVTNSLLGSAFGNKIESKWKAEDFLFMSLKGYFCGLIELENGEYKKHYLLPEFSDQGIDDAYIRSLL